jgi:hypothetical protein
MVVASYSELKAALKTLPNVEAGKVRVFRGQTCDYPTLLPRALRPAKGGQAIQKQVVWLCYSQILYHSLLPEFLQKSGETTMEMLQAFGLWVHAVAQHYGPGSDFLDVTHSVEVALWFALHEIQTHHGSGVIGPPGAPDPMRDHPMLVELVSYAPCHEPGYLYVFDLPKWDGESVAPLGAVVDVAEAPIIFSSSKRMQAQAACLVYCRNDKQQHLDLKTLRVPGTPIQVQRPMAGLGGLDRRVPDLFPSPEQDPWYARLLSVPMCYAPDPAPPRLQKCIPVTVYFDPENAEYVRELRFRNWIVSPPLLHRWVEGAAHNAPASDVIQLVAQAAPIILEAPMVFPYPPGDSDLWHQGLLASDIPDSCMTYNLATQLPEMAVPLNNVLFEFSPLEKSHWEKVVKDNAPMNVLRGVWLRRQPNQDEIEAGLFYQNLPGEDPNNFVAFRLRYDPALGEFVLMTAQGKPPLRISQNADIAREIIKPIFVALMLLRHLSTKVKPDPSPAAKMGIVESGQEKSLFILGCCGDAARLFRVPAAPHRDWFVIRDSGHPEEPFTSSRQTAGVLELKSNLPFNKIPMDAIRPSPGSSSTSSPSEKN